MARADYSKNFVGYASRVSFIRLLIVPSSKQPTLKMCDCSDGAFCNLHRSLSSRSAGAMVLYSRRSKVCFGDSGCIGVFLFSMFSSVSLSGHRQQQCQPTVLSESLR